MRIRQRKHSRTSEVSVSLTNSTLLSSRVSPQSPPLSEKHPVPEQAKNLPVQRQRARELSHDLSQVAISAKRSPTFAKNSLVQPQAEYQFAPTKNEGAKLQSLKAPIKSIRQRDRRSKFSGLEGFKGEYKPLFVAPNDVEQGQVENCYLLAKMAMLARTNPDELAKYIRPKENGIYEVTIYINSQPNAKGGEVSKTPVTITVDDILPPSGYGRSAFEQMGEVNMGGQVELLLMLVEKAYATYKGTYDASLWSRPEEEISQLTANNGDTYNIDKFSERQVANIINTALEKNLAVTTATPSMSENTKERAANINPGITEKTAYIVKKVDPSSLTINLQSSWGSSHDVNNLSISEFKRFFPRIRLRR